VKQDGLDADEIGGGGGVFLLGSDQCLWVCEERTEVIFFVRIVPEDPRVQWACDGWGALI
jgi:hypothetical protein